MSASSTRANECQDEVAERVCRVPAAHRAVRRSRGDAPGCRGRQRSLTGHRAGVGNSIAHSAVLVQEVGVSPRLRAHATRPSTTSSPRHRETFLASRRPQPIRYGGLRPDRTSSGRPRLSYACRYLLSADARRHGWSSRRCIPQEATISPCTSTPPSSWAQRVYPESTTPGGFADDAGSSTARGRPTSGIGSNRAPLRRATTNPSVTRAPNRLDPVGTRPSAHWSESLLPNLAPRSARPMWTSAGLAYAEHVLDAFAQRPTARRSR